MIGAFWADLRAALELARVDQLAAARAFDPQILRDLKIGALLVRLFGTKLAPALEEIPHRRHGAPFRVVDGSLAYGRVARRTRLDPRAYGTLPGRARLLPGRLAGCTGGKRSGFWRCHVRRSLFALVPEVRDEDAAIAAAIPSATLTSKASW